MNNLKAIYFKEFDLYITGIEKAGVCTTRTFILKHYNLYSHPRDLWGNKIRKYIVNLHLNKINKNTKVLILKRNPYDRLISGYLDKFIRSLKLGFCKNINKKVIHEGNNRLSFKEFINELYKIKDRKSSFDTHFKPQTNFYNYDILSKHKNITIIDIYNKEKIDEYLSKFNFKIPFQNVSYSISLPKINVDDIYNKRYKYYLENRICFDKKINYNNFLTNKEINKKINEIFKNDFEKLGYKLI